MSANGELRGEVKTVSARSACEGGRVWKTTGTNEYMIMKLLRTRLPSVRSERNHLHGLLDESCMDVEMKSDLLNMLFL